MGWSTARLGYDGLQITQEWEWEWSELLNNFGNTKSLTSQYAQKLGPNIGIALYTNSVYRRHPFNDQLKVDVPTGPIMYGEL